MKNVARSLAVATFAVALAACAATTGSSPLDHHEGRTVFTQRNIWVDGDMHETTNYRRGWLLPVNSNVRILSAGGQALVLEVVDSGRRFKIVNVQEYTMADIQTIYDRYFGGDPADMDHFSADSRRAIENGEITTGMSKDAVLVARGYPPAHRTNVPDENEWTYWQSRYDQRIVHFDNGKVSDIRD